MKRGIGWYARSQDGFTLVEVVIACAICLMVMTGLTSVILTSIKASSTAASRIEASGQVRNFILHADDDFARSVLPSASGCTQPSPCTTQSIVLSGLQVTNSTTPVPGSYTVTYTWDGTALLDRQVTGSPSSHIAANVTDYSWYLDGASPHQAVVIRLTVTVPLPGSVGPTFAFAGTPYSEYHILRFSPQVNP